MLEEKVDRMQKENFELNKKVLKLENYSKKYNLKFHGITETTC